MPAIYVRVGLQGLLLFDDTGQPSDFIGDDIIASHYGTPESWIAQRVLRRCGYSGLLRGT